MAEVGGTYRILILFLVSRLTNAIFPAAAFDELSGYNETTGELCQLPPYPDHGGYIVLNEKDAKPGDKFVNVSLVQYTNEDNSKVFEIKRLTCSLGEWYQDILEYQSTTLQFYTSWCPYFCHSFFNDKRAEFSSPNIRRQSKKASNNVSSTTELRAIKDNITSSKYCLLPPYPDKGTYTVPGNPEAKPGDIFQNVSLIQYISDEGNTIVAIEYFKCSKGTWHQKIFRKTSENLQFHTEWCPTLCSGFFGGLQSAESGYYTRDTYEQMNQKTINANSCVLPPHPDFGKYTVLSESDPGKPGDAYEVLRLNYTCDSGYSVVGNSNVYCLNGTWSHDLPKCIKFCALIKQPGVEYLCEDVDAVGDLRPCNDHEQDGSTIYPQCSRPYYAPKSSLKPMICENGEWSNVPQCKPVCGLRLQTPGRIETDPRIKAPWNVAVYSTDSETYNHICGGSIVASKLVISVAQCFYAKLEKSQETSGFIVAAGKIYRSFHDPNDDKAQISNVTKIKIPPRFFSILTSYQDDIALVFLSTPFVFNEYVLPICVNFDLNFDRIQLREARIGQVAAWGRTDNKSMNIVLQVVELPVIDVKQCFNSKSYDYDRFITADKMCGGYMNDVAMIGSNRTSTLAAYVLCTINIFAIVLSLSVFCLGLWMMFSPNSLVTAAQLTGSPTVKVLFRSEVLSLQFAVGLAFISIFVFSICFMGFYGAISKSQFLLFMYTTLVLLLLLLECALFFYFSSRFLEKGLEEREPEWGHTLRVTWACCDRNATFFTADPDSKPPWSCCGPGGYPDKCTASAIYTKDCHTVISKWLHRYQTTVYTSLAVLHVVLASCSLLRRTRAHPFHSHS